MDIQEIKNRLKELGLSRARFAAGIGVSVPSVHAWLSEFREIPSKRMDVIEYFLSHYSADQNENKEDEVLAVAETEDEPKSEPRVRYVVAPLSEEEYAIMLRAAAILGVSENEFARHALMSESENVIDARKNTGQKNA